MSKINFKHWLFLLVSAIVLLFQGCSSATDTEMVKSGFLSSNKSITVGNAFDKYGYFKSTNWEEIIKKNGVHQVKFTGKLNLEKAVTDYVNQRKSNPKYVQIIKVLELAKEASVIVYFTINQDKTFQIMDQDAFLKIFIDIKGGTEKVGFIKDGTLQAIYEDLNILLPQYKI